MSYSNICESNLFDVIGDIHGQYQKLVDLLDHMEYRWEDGVYRHSTRKVIFLGDFIDRGPQQKSVLDLVMKMVSQGEALAVMGNHEYNALAIHTKDPEQPDCWLRPRTNRNLVQHMAFLQEYLVPQRSQDLQQVLDFFRSLPLWLELPSLRVIHACWDTRSMEQLTPYLKDNRLTPEGLVKTCRRGSAEFNALETLLKGPETHLPDGIYFEDKYGIRRTKLRLKWWHENSNNLAEQVMDSGPGLAPLKHLNTVPVLNYPADQKPLFIGHYWFHDKPAPIKPNFACLDYSAARNGPLVAYRFNGDNTLSQEQFCYVSE